MKKIQNKFKSYIIGIYEMTRRPLMNILPGQLSFFLLLAIIPIFLLIGTITSYLSVSNENIISFMNSNFPTDISILLQPLLDVENIEKGTIFIIISAILLVSKGTRSIIRVSSVIYEIDKKNSVLDFAKSIVLSILLTLLISFIILIPVYSSKLLLFFSNFELISFLNDEILYLYNIFKWPLTIFVIFIIIKLIYIIAPSKEITSKSVNLGSLFTTLLWTLSTYFYSFYIANFSSYNALYKSASSLIILMLWLYLISYIFVLGLCINANYYKE